MGSYQTWSREQPYSQRILEISLPHSFLPQNDRKCMGRDNEENLHLAWKHSPESVVSTWGTCSLRDCFFGEDLGLLEKRPANISLDFLKRVGIYYRIPTDDSVGNSYFKTAKTERLN
ncbi:hypothetical protein AVEN_179487-1 [Araneus ventricosus]|uniref:Uncharacterized protein n=1 Tax=Araneus ventricosus TaxID=182803 RepID=A0A4Y2BE87_ARAVE|nr:hypothetical protein AVEN_179487-1 [Araneus ventricosus]